MSTEEEIKNLISFLTKRRIPLVYTSRKEKHPFEDGVLGYLGPSLPRTEEYSTSITSSF